MIQSIIDTLHLYGIEEIYVVVGYLKEQFSTLKDVFLVENDDYSSANNIASLYAVREKLGNCFVIDGDQVIRNPEIFHRDYDSSGYFACYNDSYTKEWMLQCDDQYRILSCDREGGKDGYQLYGISYWNEEDGKCLSSLLEKVYKKEKKTHIYWDDVALFCYPEQFSLRVYPISADSVQEIDNKEEYEAILTHE